MKLLSHRIAICVCVMAVFAALIPVSANAYVVNLTGYQKKEYSPPGGAPWAKEIYSGEIYGYLNSNPSDTAFFFCMEEEMDITVPGGPYYARDLMLTGLPGLRAAWLMDNYAPTLNGKYDDYDLITTGVAVQSAIWFVRYGQWYVNDQDIVNIATTMVDSIPIPLDPYIPYLQSHYAYVDLYLDPNMFQRSQDLIRPVPIPPAAWLLGSGLLGLVALGRRSRKYLNK